MIAVVDASIVCKWFFPESGSDAATKLLEYDRLIAPELLYAEVGNVCWKRVRSREISVAEGTDVLASLVRIPLEIADTRALAHHALELAVEFGRTFYDSLYLALAVQSGTQLATADEKLVNSLANTTLGGTVRLVR